MPSSGRDADRPQRRDATEAEALAMASPLRLRILRLTLEQPLTNREIAERLGRNPASVLHHVRRLVDTGFLAAQEPRRGRRGAREIPYLATRLSWRLNARPGHRAMLQAFLDETEGLGPEDLQMSRLGVRLPAQRWAEFRDRLHDLLDEMAEGPSDPDADAYSIFLAIHPDRRGTAPADPRPPTSGTPETDA